MQDDIIFLQTGFKETDHSLKILDPIKEWEKMKPSLSPWED